MIQPGKVPVIEENKYSFQQAAEILDLRDGKKKLGRNLLMDILKECNVLDWNGIAYPQFVTEGYFYIGDKRHQPRVEIRHDRYTLVVGEKGLEFVRAVVTKYLADRKPPYPPPTFGPCSGQNIL